MYQIKQKPEDFIVKEISSIGFADDGDYAIFLLKKINYNTIDVIKKIANFLNIKQRQIGFAGTKDKNAVTEQFISIPKKYKEKLTHFKLKNIELKFKGYSKEPLFLGDLIGNEFEIVISNLKANEINEFIAKYKDVDKVKIINYFGEQRFSKNNTEIGRLLVKGNFKQAVELIKQSNNEFKNKINIYLKTRQNDYVGALKLLPEKLLKLYVHAYQSMIWNIAVKEFINTKKIENMENIKIPILGFDSAIQNKELKNIIENIMQKESLVLRDFIIRPLPHLSQEGSDRDLFVYAEDFKIIKSDKDELNENKFKIKISFKLTKGSYATEAVRWLFG